MIPLPRNNYIYFFPFWSIIEIGHLLSEVMSEEFSLCLQLLRKMVPLTYF